MSGGAAAGRARGLLAAAERHEGQGDHGEAARLYFQAAAALLEASEGAPDGRTAQVRLEMATALHQRGLRLRGGEKPVVTVPANGQQQVAALPEPAKSPRVTFADVAGMEGVKRELHDRILLPLRHPEVFRKYGKTAGGGVLLYGPPGCGKTFIARAAAGESGAAFFPVQLADILDKFVGGSEKALRDVFAAARQARPAIVFLDEIDAIGSSRLGQQSDHGKRLLNQLLTLMDGATADGEDPLDGVLVIGATNLPEALDPALVRAGRFDAKVEVPFPDEPARRGIAERALAKLVIGPEVLDQVVRDTEGQNAADVVAVCDTMVMEQIRSECAPHG